MKELSNAVKDFIEALNNVPGVQLMHIEDTLRQLRTDLGVANLPIMADLDTLIEDAAIADAEVRAILEEEHYKDMCQEAHSCGYCGPIIPTCDRDDSLPF